jgi:hypothetical protein
MTTRNNVITAIGEVLNEEGFTCWGGSHEPGHYKDCERCHRVCDRVAGEALDAALPLIRDALADAIHKREIAAGLGDVEAPKTWWDAYQDAAGIVNGMDL